MVMPSLPVIASPKGVAISGKCVSVIMPVGSQIGSLRLPEGELPEGQEKLPWGTSSALGPPPRNDSP